MILTCTREYIAHKNSQRSITDFGVISDIEVLGYFSLLFWEAKFGAVIRISEANFGAKSPDLLIWKYPLGQRVLNCVNCVRCIHTFASFFSNS